MSKKQPRVQVARDGKVLAEYANLQLPSLLETGHLNPGDHCFDAEAQAWIPLEDYMKDISGFSRKGRNSEPAESAPAEKQPARAEQERSWQSAQVVPWLLAFFALAAAVGAGLFAWTQSAEIATLRDRLATAEQAKAGLQKQYDEALLKERDLAPGDLVRGRVIIRSAAGNRTAPPGVKVRLFARSAIADHLEARFAAGTSETGGDPSRLAVHYMKDLPSPIETTTTDSDGRFELKVPEPGDYVIQSSLISAKTREMRLWFIAFNSRDPLNTPVDINDSNVVRQFDPLLMLVEGR